MIRCVRVKGYKSLVDVTVELKPLTVVFGPNAAGYGMQILANIHSPILPGCFDDAASVVCRQQDRRTEFTPFQSVGPLLRSHEIKNRIGIRE